MPVFISHRTADDHVANAVYLRLTRVHSIKCYLDNFDDEAKSAGQSRITRLIVDRLTACTNLLALVTVNTRGSWWVPFEVGVARQAPRMITSFTTLDDSELPEYLKEWPILRGENAIDIFAAAYKRQLSSATRILLAEQAGRSAAFSSVDAFHKELKSALRQ